MRQLLLQELLLVTAFAGVVAAVELMSRYRDAPVKALRSWPGVAYMAVNVAAGLAALGAIHLFDLRFGLTTTSPGQLSLVRALAAGLGSAALFRSSLLTVKEGGQDLPVGPGALLEALKRSVDAEIDRRRAVQRLHHDLLRGLSFDRHHTALTELCTGALQNLDLADAQRLGESAAALAFRTDLSDVDKLDRFGLDLLTLVGESALTAAADRLREREASAETTPIPVVAETPTLPAHGDPATDSRPAFTQIGYEPSQLRVSTTPLQEPTIDLWPTVSQPPGSTYRDTVVSLRVTHPDFAPLLELTQAILRAPGLPELHARRAEVLTKLGHLRSAEHDIRHALSVRPGDPDLLLRLALILADREHFQQAREAAVDRPDIHVLALFELAIDQRDTDPNAAAALMSEAVHIMEGAPEMGRFPGVPPLAELIVLRAECNVRQGEFRSAITDLDRLESDEQQTAVVAALLRAHLDGRDPHEEVFRLLRAHPVIRAAGTDQQQALLEDGSPIALADVLWPLAHSRRHTLLGVPDVDWVLSSGPPAAVQPRNPLSLAAESRPAP